MTKMTEQQKFEMQEVVEKMPDVFAARTKDGVFVFRGWWQKSIGAEALAGYARQCDKNEIVSLILSPSQHAAWVEKKLMEWLEERGYRVNRVHGGRWSVDCPGTSVVVGQQGHAWYNSLWPCLYAAREHWEESQKSKEKEADLERKLRDCIKASFPTWEDFSACSPSCFPTWEDFSRDIIVKAVMKFMKENKR